MLDSIHYKFVSKIDMHLDRAQAILPLSKDSCNAYTGVKCIGLITSNRKMFGRRPAYTRFQLSPHHHQYHLILDIVVVLSALPAPSSSSVCSRSPESHHLQLNRQQHSLWTCCEISESKRGTFRSVLTAIFAIRYDHRHRDCRIGFPSTPVESSVKRGGGREGNHCASSLPSS